MDIFLTFLFLALGIFMIFKGIRILMGYEKARFFSPWVRINQTIWMAIPGGVVFLMWGLAFAQSLVFGINRTTAGLGIILIVGSFVVLFIGLLLAFIKPKFLKPKWLKWIEREHGDIMPLLRHEAREMGLDVWSGRVSTQEDLEKWVVEVRQKHGV